MSRRNRVSKLRGKRDSLQVEITHCCQRMSSSLSSENIRDLLSKISKLEEACCWLASLRVELPDEADGAQHRGREAQEDAE